MIVGGLGPDLPRSGTQRGRTLKRIQMEGGGAVSVASDPQRVKGTKAKP